MKKSTTLLIICAFLGLSIISKKASAQCSSPYISAIPQTTSCQSNTINFTGNCVATTFDFNTGLIPSGWDCSPFVVGSPCYTNTPDNSPYFWATTLGTNYTRYVVTNSVNVTTGGNIVFDMRFGSDDPFPGCEDPDLIVEGVFLQYSNNNGVWENIQNWIPISGYQGPLYAWNTYIIPIPLGAIGPNTRFRWFQPFNSGEDWDNWGLDDIYINAPLDGIVAYLWDFGDGTTSTAASELHTYTNPGQYTVTLTITDIFNNVSSVTETVNIDFPMSGTYTLGASSSDFVDFASAVSQLQTFGVSGPVVFNIASGTYTEQITIGEIPCASSINTITFQSASGDSTDVVIQYAATGTGNNWVVKLDGADYISFKNLTIKATGTGFAYGVHLQNDAEYNTIENCIVMSTSWEGYCIPILLYQGNYNQYNSFKNNVIQGGYWGIYCTYDIYYWTSYPQGNVFEGNEIKDFFAYGAYFGYQNSLQFNGNIIDNGLGVDTTWNYGNYFEIYGAKFDYCDNTEVVGNKINIHSPTNQIGIYLLWSESTSANPSLFANNFISLSGNDIDSWNYGMWFDSWSTNINVYFNSVNITGGSADWYSCALWHVDGENFNYKNNIFNNLGGGYSAYFEIDDPTGVASSDYNDYYTTGSILAYWDDDKTNLADLQAASGMDANSVSVDPGFYSPTDLHVISIDINEAGTPIAEITTDIEGDARDATTPDIGADEFTPPPYDAGVISIDEPLNPASIGNNTVKVSIRNFGSEILTSATIKLQINGMLVGSYPWTGSLAYGASLSNISLGTHNFTAGLSQLKAWTENPNGQIDAYASNDTTEAMMNICDPLSGTYTIGGTSPDFIDFASAVFPLQHCGITGAVVFNIASGTYAEQITIGEIQGVSATNTITFQSASGDSTDVVIQYATNDEADNWVVLLDGADYILFKNLSIKAIGTTYANAVHLTNGAEHNVFESNIIQSLMSNWSQTSPVVLNSGALNQYNTFENNVIQGGDIGIRCEGQNSSSIAQGNVFKGNEIKDFYGYGAYFVYQNSLQFDDNIVDNQLGSIYVYGTSFTYCDNMHVVGNKVNIHGTSGHYGIYLKYCDATSANPGLIANNFISLTGTGNNTWNGIYLYNINYLNVYFNSVNLIGGSTSSTAIYQRYGSNQNYKNNIFTNSGGGYSAYFYTPNAIVSSDYNDYYTTGTYLAYWGGDRTVLADLQGASGKDVHSVSADPVFDSPTNLHVHSIDINGAGTPVTGITTDIEEDARDATTPDIGADEFTPAAYDAGVISIDEPLNPASPGSNTVKVSIRNFGTATLSSIPIILQINGGAINSYTWTGSLASGASASNISLGTYNLTEGVTHLKAWTEIPNDAYALNDTTEAMMNICDPLTGTYTIGGASPDFIDFASAVSQLQNCGIVGAVVFDIAIGSYTEQITIDQIQGVSAINTITFQSASGDSTDVVIQYGASSYADNWVVKLDGAKYISFKNLTIKSTGNPLAYAVHLTNGAEYNVFESNIIQSLTSPSWSSVSSNVVFDKGALNQYNTFENNVIEGGYYGIYCNGNNSSSLAQGNVFKGNEIKDFYQIGARFLCQNSLQFDDNIVDNLLGSTSVVGVSFSTCDNIHVVGNKINIHGTSGHYGMNISDCDATSANPGLIANNFISLTGTGTGTWYGLYLNKATYLSVYYNSVNLIGGATSSSAVYQRYGSNQNYKNNIFINSGGGYSAYFSSPGAIASTDYNDYHTTGTWLAYWYPSDRTDLAALQTVSGKDVHSLSVDHTFNSATDLHTSNIFLDNAGTPVVGITDDIDGETRSVTTPDIGADEFTGPPYDGGVIAIDEPINSASPGNNTVKVSIKNFGTVTLTSITIKLEINGVTLGSYLWTGSLAYGVSESNISLGTHNITAGIAQLKAWTENPNGQIDAYAINDTTEAERHICNPLTGIYTIGGISPDFSNFASAVAHLEYCGINGSVVFNVASGTYTEQITIGQIQGVSATNTITFQSASGDSTDVVIQYAAIGVVNNKSDNWVVKLDGAEYISFKNLTIKATGAIYAYGVYITNGAHNVFESNIIQSITSTGGSYKCAVVLHSDKYSVALNNYNTFKNNVIEGGSVGIACYGKDWASYDQGNVFEGNEIKDFYQTGANFNYQNSLQFNNNIVDNQLGSTFVKGIGLHNCDNIHVVGNKINIHGTSSHWGMQIESCHATSANPGLIANNFISLTGSITSQNVKWYGMYIGYSQDINIYYNSVNLIRGNYLSSALYQVSGVNQNYKNNIFLNSSFGYSAIYDNTTAQYATISSDYNDYYTTGTNFVYWAGDRDNLGALQEASFKDIHSLSVDPTFNSATDLHTSNVYLDNAGTPIAGITTDIDGDDRDVTTPDIGADEHVANIFITVITKDTTVYLDVNGQAQIIPADVDNGTNGNCSFTLSVSPDSFTCNDVGPNTVTLTATGPGGYSASETAVVTVISNIAVDAGPDETTYFGYPGSETVVRTAVASGGTPPYSYSWTLNRPLICNQVNPGGDELFSGGACTNNICPVSGSPSVNPSCSGSETISATLMEPATVSVTVTDANGCTATDDFFVDASDIRCYSGNSGAHKVWICHHTNSPNNPWVEICVDTSAVAAHLAHGDYLGPCNGNRSAIDEEEANVNLNLTLFPNPTQGRVTLAFDSEVEHSYTVDLMDITGRKLATYSGDARHGENIRELALGNIEAGMYQVVLILDGKREVKKLIIK